MLFSEDNSKSFIGFMTMYIFRIHYLSGTNSTFITKILFVDDFPVTIVYNNGLYILTVTLVAEIFQRLHGYRVRW